MISRHIETELTSMLTSVVEFISGRLVKKTTTTVSANTSQQVLFIHPKKKDQISHTIYRYYIQCLYTYYIICTQEKYT